MYEIRYWLSARLPPSSPPPSLLYDGTTVTEQYHALIDDPTTRNAPFAQQYIPYDSLKVFFGLSSYTVTLRLAISCICVYLAQTHQRVS
jgi:hypothetical protein